MKAKLYLWENEGGLSIQWDLPDNLLMHPFFIFGRFGGGWKPFGSLNEKARAEAELGIKRAKEQFGLETEIIWGKSPDESGEVKNVSED